MLVRSGMPANHKSVCGLADKLLGFAVRVIRGRCEVVQDNRRCSPVRNEGSIAIGDDESLATGRTEFPTEALPELDAMRLYARSRFICEPDAPVRRIRHKLILAELLQYISWYSHEACRPKSHATID